MLETIFANFDRKPDIGGGDGATSLRAAVESGRGVALVPEVFRSLGGSGVRLRPIDPAPPPMIVGCAYWLQAHPLSPHSVFSAQFALFALNWANRRFDLERFVRFEMRSLRRTQWV